MKMVINELLGFNQNEGIFMVLLFFNHESIEWLYIVQNESIEWLFMK